MQFAQDSVLLAAKNHKIADKATMLTRSTSDLQKTVCEKPRTNS